MKTRYKILISIILLIVCVGLIFVGVLLFNRLPDVTTSGYTNPKDGVVATGMLFAFLFGVFAFVGSLGFLVSAFVEYDY